MNHDAYFLHPEMLYPLFPTAYYIPFTLLLLIIGNFLNKILNQELSHSLLK
jgi:hypothetical protein